MAGILENPIYLLPPLFAFAIGIFLALLVLRKDFRSQSHQVFALFLLSAALWGLFIYLMRASPDAQHALFWERFVPITGFGLFIFYYHFTCIYTRSARRGVLLCAYALLVLITAFVFSGLMIKEMTVESYGYAPRVLPAFYFYSFASFVLMVMALVTLVRTYRRTAQHQERTRLSYMIIAPTFPFVIGILDFFPSLPPVSLFGNIMFCLLTAVALLRFHLMDIQIAIRRGTTYLLVSTLIAIPYLGIITGVSRALGSREVPLWVHAVLLLSLAFALQFAWKGVHDWVERRFYRNRYKYVRALEELSHRTTGLIELERLANPLLTTLAAAVEADSAYLLLPSGEGIKLMASSNPDYRYPRISLPVDSPIFSFLEHHGGYLYRRDFELVTQLQALSSKETDLLLKELQGELFMPLKIRDKLVGMLVLGPKPNQQSYSASDLQIILSTIPQLTVTVDNARLYEAEKQRASELALLGRLGAIVTSELDIGRAYQGFISELSAVVPIDSSYIALIEDEKAELSIIAAYSSKEPVWSVSQSMPLPGSGTAWVREHHNLHYEPDLSQHMTFSTDEDLRQKGMRSVVRLPLYGGEDVLGSFVLASQTPNAYTEDNLRLLRQAADQVAIATQNFLLYDNERRARLEIERQNRERIELIEALAHEIKTPLTPIVASSELLLEELATDNSPLRNLARNLTTGAQNLNRRISELMDFAKMQRAGLTFNLQSVDVHRLLEHVASEMTPLLRSRGQGLGLRVPASLPRARADPERVEQVLLNLLTNANKFSPGDTEISLRARQEDGSIVIEVADSAPRLTEEEVKSIFTPYYRSERVRRTHGVGLGLAICKHLVEIQGGRIWIGQNSETGGNIFGFSLPVSGEMEAAAELSEVRDESPVDRG